MVPGNEGGVWHACLQGVLTVHGMDVQHHVLMANRSTTRPEHVRARVRPDTLLHPLPLSPHTHTHPHPSTNPPHTHTTCSADFRQPAVPHCRRAGGWRPGGHPASGGLAVMPLELPWPSTPTVSARSAGPRVSRLLRARAWVHVSHHRGFQSCVTPPLSLRVLLAHAQSHAIKCPPRTAGTHLQPA